MVLLGASRHRFILFPSRSHTRLLTVGQSLVIVHYTPQEYIATISASGGGGTIGNVFKSVQH